MSSIVTLMPALAWLVLSGLLFAGGEFLSKKFALAPGWFFLICTLLTYTLATLTWLPALMQKNELSITGSLWSVISLLMTVLIGILIFGEKPGTIGIAGIICACVAVFLLTIAS